MVTADVGLAADHSTFGHWLQGNRQYATNSSARNTKESQSIVPGSELRTVVCYKHHRRLGFLSSPRYRPLALPRQLRVWSRRHLTEALRLPSISINLDDTPGVPRSLWPPFGSGKDSILSPSTTASAGLGFDPVDIHMIYCTH